MRKSNENLVRKIPNGRLMKGNFDVVNGDRLPCSDYDDADVQNAYYEGYTSNLVVTNLFVFNFFVEVIHAGIKFPGSWHDTKMASASGLLDPNLGDAIPPLWNSINGDSAFSCTLGAGVAKSSASERRTKHETYPTL